MKTFTDWLESRGLQPKNPDLYREACTHSSYANEHHCPDNERLEFMGDAVLQVWSADKLFNMQPPMREGRMTTLRAQIVCEATLARLSERYGWNRFLLLGVGEERTGGRTRKSLMADHFEACLGAVYLDLGYPAAAALLDEIMLPEFTAEKGEDVTDYKSHLQEVIQSDTRKNLEYRLLSETGPANAPTFTMGVYLDDIQLGTGTSSSKKRAEQKAARDAFEKMAR